jgi:hypothetical protein
MPIKVEIDVKLLCAICGTVLNTQEASCKGNHSGDVWVLPHECRPEVQGESPATASNKARQQALREISADMKNVISNQIDYTRMELLSIIESWQKLLPC